MPKRKVINAENGVEKEEPRRSSRRTGPRVVKRETQPATESIPPPTVKKARKSKKAQEEIDDEVVEEIDVDEESMESNPIKTPDTKTAKSAVTTKPTPTNDTSSSTSERQYWLMKAEPESRFEKGKDIKFSIDDLAAKKEPEPWDGIRAYPARNNLRAMKKGDLAFFYHSSCKIPAIVGTMEIVQEHTPDLTAHDSSAPYYDPKSKPEDPKWSVVHVEFRQKLKTPITLKELKEWHTTKGNPLESMQMLKLARLSVSKISAAEWGFLTGEMRERGDEVS